MIVVDASVGLKWVYDEPGSQSAREVLDRGERLEAPELWLLEIGNALRRRCAEGLLEPAEVLALLNAIANGRVMLTPDRPLAASALELSLQLGHPVYDCVYLALAIARGARLVTADAKFLKVARRGGYDSLIELIGAPQP